MKKGWLGLVRVMPFSLFFLLMALSILKKIEYRTRESVVSEESMYVCVHMSHVGCRRISN